MNEIYDEMFEEWAKDPREITYDDTLEEDFARQLDVDELERRVKEKMI